MSTVEYIDKTCTIKELFQAMEDDVAVFKLIDVSIEGDDDDMYSLSSKVRGHPNLKEFICKNVKVVDTSTSLDLVVSSLLISAYKIETLELENTPVKSSALLTLGHCPTLKKLVLCKNGYNDADATKIADALAGNKVITTVDLSDNEMSDVGCKAFEICLDKNDSVNTLNLSGNGGISGEKFNKIEAKLQGRAAIAAWADQAC